MVHGCFLAGGAMKADSRKRQAEITEMLSFGDFVTVESLSEKFTVTNQTIRRDLRVLSEKGLVLRKHGGAERMILTTNQAYTSRQILNSAAKYAIARSVAQQVPDGASLAFSIGTTPEIVARCLLNHRNLRIVTNNLNVAVAAAANPTFEITIAGGRIRNDDLDVLGDSTEQLFESYKVDIGVFGVAGVDNDGTMLDFHEDEVRTRLAILNNCRSSMLVLDYTKFTRTAHVRGGFIGRVDQVFCEQRPPRHILDYLIDAQTELVICAE
jgi:DeoR family glycerol-3-phosphate regulon repressor